jgi:hypothetical protein
MNLGIKLVRSVLGVKSTPTSVPAAATAKAEDDPPYAGPGLHCRPCRLTIATTLPLRHCPRCGTRFYNVPADPNEEPMEAIDEKIQQTRFAQRGWIGWNWGGWWLGTCLGVVAAAIHLYWNPDPFRKQHVILEIFAWYLFFGGLVGCALGVCWTGLVWPILLALFNSKRFEQEYGWQDKRPPDFQPPAPSKGEPS